MVEEKKQEMILVPERWLKSLMDDALAFEEAQKNWEWDKSFTNNKILNKAMVLMGYAKSSQFLLEHNERVTK